MHSKIYNLPVVTHDWSEDNHWRDSGRTTHRRQFNFVYGQQHRVENKEKNQETKVFTRPKNFFNACKEWILSHNKTLNFGWLKVDYITKMVVVKKHYTQTFINVVPAHDVIQDIHRRTIDLPHVEPLTPEQWLLAEPATDVEIDSAKKSIEKQFIDAKRSAYYMGASDLHRPFFMIEG